MLVRTDLRGRTLTAAELRQAMPRGGSDPSAVTDTVATLVEDNHQAWCLCSTVLRRKIRRYPPHLSSCPRRRYRRRARCYR